MVNAFLTASRGGEFDALLAVVDPDVVVRADHAAIALGALSEVRGAPAVATRSLTFSWCTRFSQPALVNGAGGVVVAPRDRLSAVMLFTIRHGKIAEIDALADPARLRQLDLAVLAG